MAQQKKNTANLVPVEDNARPSEKQERKMTIYEYEEKYVRRQNVRGVHVGDEVVGTQNFDERNEIEKDK